MSGSALELAIRLGLSEDGDLAEELQAFGEYQIESVADAVAIVEALKSLSLATKPDAIRAQPALHALTGLFQQVDGRDAPAFEVLANDGTVQLVRLYDERIQDADEREIDVLLFILKILAMYGTRRGTEKVLQALRQPVKPEAYMWSVILSMYTEGHPQRDLLFESTGEHLPGGFAAVALLDAANSLAINGGHIQHPFDSSAGKQLLMTWLSDSDPDAFSYAHSATAALPFIGNPERNQLLALAMDHTDPGVQMEAAWASARLGSDAGVKLLARFSLDVNHSQTACQYLTELDREDAIPDEATDPDFRAQAEFAEWLAHPNELGRAPDAVEIVDSRELAWPPERQLKRFWLIKYRVIDDTGLDEDEVDCGLVGSLTFCLFSCKMAERPPEDCYAIHCFWELAIAEKIEEVEVDPEASGEHAFMLEQWTGPPLQNPIIVTIANLDPELDYPQTTVALARAICNGIEGWVALDGPRSTWYPAADFPRDTEQNTVLKIHVGRRLLDFNTEPDRTDYLQTENREHPPSRIIEAYERLLDQVTAGDDFQHAELLGYDSPLGEHFRAYAHALSRSTLCSTSQATVQAYEKLLAAADRCHESVRDDVYDTFSALGEHFDEFVEALVATGQSSQVAQLISIFEPRWDHNLGYQKLGKAAFLCGEMDVAERFLLTLRRSLDDCHRGESMSVLAEIWHRQGRAKEASDLLIDCLRKLRDEGQTAKGSDTELFEDWYQHHRASFLRLFPDGESQLNSLGIA